MMLGVLNHGRLTIKRRDMLVAIYETLGRKRKAKHVDEDSPSLSGRILILPDSGKTGIRVRFPSLMKIIGTKKTFEN